MEEHHPSKLVVAGSIPARDEGNKMLVIKVEIWPHGDEKRKEIIEEMKIINVSDHPMRPLYGNYKIESDGTKAKVLHHDRRENVWHLVRKSIDAIINISSKEE